MMNINLMPSATGGSISHSTKKLPTFGCAQFAHMVNQPYRGEDRFIRQCLLNGQNALQGQSKNNPDGWGIAAYSQHQKLSIWKSTLQARLDPLFARRAKQTSHLKPLVTLAHLREGSPLQITNNHPFPIGKAILMHNGYVPEIQTQKMKADLALEESKNIPANSIPKLRGTTDTEVFTRHLQMELLKKFGTNNPTQIPTKPLASLFNQKVSALVEESKNIPDDGPIKIGYNFTLADDKRIIASRHGRSLYIGTRPERGLFNHPFFNRHPNLNRKDSAAHLQEVLIATNPMQIRPRLLQWFREKPITWTEIPKDQIVIIERVPTRSGTRLKVAFQKLQTEP